MAKIYFTIWLVSDDPDWPDSPDYQAKLDTTPIADWRPSALVPGAPSRSVWALRSREAGRQVTLRISANGSAGTRLTAQVIRGDGSVALNQPFDVPFQPATLAFTV
jgi:hypothetical protein